MTTASPPPARYSRPRLRARLSIDEGRKRRVYLDTEGKRTIGVGRNLDDVGIRPEEAARLGITLAGVIRDGLTEPQIDVLLDSDIDAAERDLDAKLPWWRSLDAARQAVLVNMCFNMGIGNGIRGLTSFRNTLAAIRDRRFADAAAGMLASKWADQVGNRAVRLANAMLSGVEP